MATDIIIPLWGVLTLICTFVLAIFIAFIRVLCTMLGKKKNGNNGCSSNGPAPTLSVPNHNHTFITKDMCEQTQQTMHAEMKLLQTNIDHLNEKMDSMATNHTKEHETLSDHLDDRLDRIEKFIEKK